MKSSLSGAKLLKNLRLIWCLGGAWLYQSWLIIEFTKDVFNNHGNRTYNVTYEEQSRQTDKQTWKLGFVRNKNLDTLGAGYGSRVHFDVPSF